MASSSDIATSFATDYRPEYEHAYQRVGSKLRDLVVNETVGAGQSAIIFTVYSANTIAEHVKSRGAPSATTKDRNGDIPANYSERTNVTMTLADLFTRESVEQLDLLKIRPQERAALIEATSMTLGRKVDDLIITAMNDATGQNLIATGAATFTLAKAYDAHSQLMTNSAYEYGRAYCAVGPAQWQQLISLNAFSNRDYIGDGDIIYGPRTGEKHMWLGNTVFFPFNGLPNGAGGAGETRCFWWVENSMRYASQLEPDLDVDWDGKARQFDITFAMSSVAKRVHDGGVIAIDCLDTLPTAIS